MILNCFQNFVALPVDNDIRQHLVERIRKSRLPDSIACLVVSGAKES
jgi:hypothetical protein